MRHAGRGQTDGGHPVSDLSVKEAAARLGIHTSLVYTYIREGRIKPSRIEPLLVSPDEVERFERNRPKRGRPPVAGQAKRRGI